jgi:hypothetical protein
VFLLLDDKHAEMHAPLLPRMRPPLLQHTNQGQKHHRRRLPILQRALGVERQPKVRDFFLFPRNI